MLVYYSLIARVPLVTINIRHPRAYRVFNFVGSIETPPSGLIRNVQIHAPETTRYKTQCDKMREGRTKEDPIATGHQYCRGTQNSSPGDTCRRGLSTRSYHGSHVPAVCCTLSQGRGVHASHAHWAGRLRLVSWQAAVFPFCDGCCRASTRVGDSVRGCEGLA